MKLAIYGLGDKVQSSSWLLDRKTILEKQF